MVSQEELIPRGYHSLVLGLILIFYRLYRSLQNTRIFYLLPIGCEGGCGTMGGIGISSCSGFIMGVFLSNNSATAIAGIVPFIVTGRKVFVDVLIAEASLLVTCKQYNYLIINQTKVKDTVKINQFSYYWSPMKIQLKGIHYNPLLRCLNFLFSGHKSL